MMRGGARFRARGAASAATNVFYFGTVPDQFTILLPAHWAPTPVNNIVFDGATAAKNINQWTPYNTLWEGGADLETCSFGSTTTAPDGTSTAQKIVESTGTSRHFVSAGWVPPYGIFKMRLSVFAKAAERTRCKLSIQDYTRDPAVYTTINVCKAVFDLANGQVAIAPTVTGNGDYWGKYGNSWVAGPATITAWGNGWYRCEMDVEIHGAQTDHSQIYATFAIDAGSGTGAENSTYAGNGTSGLYTWRATCLPPGAWGLHTQTFLEEFDDPQMANIDLEDTCESGFTWYIHNRFSPPGYNALQITDPDGLSVADSKLTVDPDYVTQVNLFATTAAWNENTDEYVESFKFTMPFLAETKCAWGPLQAGADYPSGYTAFWLMNMEYLKSGPLGYPGQPIFPYEVDLFESNMNGVQWPESTTFGAGGGETKNASSIGYAFWEPNRRYNINQVAYHEGNAYQSLQADNLGNAPSSSPTYWTDYTEDPSYPNWPGCDFTQLHTYSHLMLPWTHDDSGHFITFFDGNYCPGGPYVAMYGSSHVLFAPNCLTPTGGSVSNVFHPSKWVDGYVLMLGSGTNYPCSWDQVKVTQ